MKKKFSLFLLLLICICSCSACSEAKEFPSYEPSDSIATTTEHATDSSSELAIVIEPSASAEINHSLMATIEAWFSEFVNGEWEEIQTGDQFYGESNKTKDEVDITILFYCNEYYTTEFKIRSIESSEIYTVTSPLVSAYLGRTLTKSESNSLQCAIDAVLFNPDEGVYITDFDNAAPLYLYTDRTVFYINCY